LKLRLKLKNDFPKLNSNKRILRKKVNYCKIKLKVLCYVLLAVKRHKINLKDSNSQLELTKALLAFTGCHTLQNNHAQFILEIFLPNIVATRDFTITETQVLLLEVAMEFRTGVKFTTI
jgi:hypothetical protein